MNICAPAENLYVAPEVFEEEEDDLDPWNENPVDELLREDQYSWEKYTQTNWDIFEDTPEYQEMYDDIHLDY